MNIKHIALSILGVTAIIAVLFVSKPWAQPVGDRSIVSQTPSPRAFPEVSLEDLRGIDIPELTYLEDGALYRSKPNDSNERVTRKKVAEGVKRILDEESNFVLFGKENSSVPKDADGTGEDLWILNKNSGEISMIYSDVVEADMSSTQNVIAVWEEKNYELHLITLTGVLLKRIGVHGASPLFSPDGTLLAYYKLADSSSSGSNQDLLEYAQGIAIYDMRTGIEKLITSDPRDFRPIVFLSDIQTLVFNSGREDATIWSVGIDGKNLRNLTHVGSSQLPGFVPYLGKNSLQSTDRRVVVSQFDGVLRRYIFDARGNLASAEQIGEGMFPRWAIQDKIVAFRSSRGVWEMARVNK